MSDACVTSTSTKPALRRTSHRQYIDLTIQGETEIEYKILVVYKSWHGLARAVASVKEARGHQFSAGGHEQVERRRRECRGAAGAEGNGVWGGVSPSPQGVGSGEGTVPPPQKIFLHFHVEMAHFVGILGVNFKFTLLTKQ